jgi:anhydro-N-acetylmuramic acid kinase
MDGLGLSDDSGRGKGYHVTLLARNARLAIMFYIGLISGTSVDAIDAALVSLSATGQCALAATHAHPLPATVRDQILALMRPGADEIERLGELDVALGELFAEAAEAVMTQAGVDKKDVRAIGSHGQTVRHRPRNAYRFSLQIADPSVIAERTGITTVADFRARDMAAGGEGAPLVPAFHRQVLHSPRRNRTIVNIGGIANVTYLPADTGRPVSGFDTGPGNTLLDQWIARHHGQRHDEAGSWAASGRASDQLLQALLQDRYFAIAPPKSTGREHFNLAWLEQHLHRLAPPPAAADVQATLVQLTAQTVASAIHRFLPQTEEVYVCGGGAHNRALMAVLVGQLAGIPVATTEALGWPPDWIEAAAFAWLAHQTLEGLPGNLPSVTGARRAVILGGIYKA